jgi:hypothetical protein
LQASKCAPSRRGFRRQHGPQKRIDSAARDIELHHGVMPQPKREPLGTDEGNGIAASAA